MPLAPWGLGPGRSPGWRWRLGRIVIELVCHSNIVMSPGGVSNWGGSPVGLHTLFTLLTLARLESPLYKYTHSPTVYCSALVDCSESWGQWLWNCCVLCQQDIWRSAGLVGSSWSDFLTDCGGPSWGVLWWPPPQRPDLEGSSQNGIWTTLYKTKVNVG